MRNTRIFILLISIFSSNAYSALVEEVIRLPVVVKNIYGREFQQEFVVTIFRDDSKTSSPWLVLNHGRPAIASKIAQMERVRYLRNSKYFVEKGFVVLIPTRIGYGPNNGPDVEYSGPCDSKKYPDAVQSAVDQNLAIINYAKKLSYVNPKRGMVIGQSYGGITSVALSTTSVEGLFGVINFAGGGGGNPETRPANPCREDLLRKTFADYGLGTKVPSLWLYSVNDRYFGPDLPRQWYESFKKGADNNKIMSRFVTLPPYKEDGHASFSGNPKAWEPEVETFLRELGF